MFREICQIGGLLWDCVLHIVCSSEIKTNLSFFPLSFWQPVTVSVFLTHILGILEKRQYRDDLILDLTTCWDRLNYFLLHWNTPTLSIPNQRKCWSNDLLGPFKQPFSHEVKLADKKGIPLRFALTWEKHALKNMHHIPRCYLKTFQVSKE